MMNKWNWLDILKIVGGWGLFTAMAAVISKKMDWIRFKKNDVASEDKIRAETAERKTSIEVKISDAALQWTVNLAARLEQSLAMSDKKQDEIDKLHAGMYAMKKDFERDIEKLSADFNDRIKELEKEFEKSKLDFTIEREKNLSEIKRLKNQISGIK